MPATAPPPLHQAASSEGEEEAPTTADYAGRRGATATGTITAASYARLSRALSSSLPPCSSSTAGSSLRRATIEDDGHCCYVARKRKTPSLGMRKEKEFVTGHGRIGKAASSPLASCS
nr:hypothetical protein Iba_chr06aCG14010 [Ipomoea batatas]GMD19208.1 hypothetical protein Iba_chr07eCG6060 [Ipomoea batatas]GMD19209.1 hypothetical protein Iba_chr07eCG6070 [Ipomoea batatas]